MERHPNAEILFVGANGKMEMTRVPEAGYKIIGLWISGIQRKLTLSNLLLPFKLLSSYFTAGKIVKRFKPHAVVGTGGYASGPIMLAATRNKIPSLIQEQNSYAGVTNKLLAKKADRICVAYDGMDHFFPKDKIILTGNPVRQDLFSIAPKTDEAYQFFGLDPQKKTILVVGGSLGARTINQSIIAGLNKLAKAKDVQVIWQTGKFYIKDARMACHCYTTGGLVVTDFVSRMDLAYSIADLVISRAGASSISELCLLAKPVILVPSPNVAEDHQTQNALALVRKDAAILIKDIDAKEQLMDKALELIQNEAELKKLSENILKLAEKDSADRIATEILKLIV